MVWIWYASCKTGLHFLTRKTKTTDFVGPKSSNFMGLNNQIVGIIKMTNGLKKQYRREDVLNIS